jgi:hypothetical protein
MTTAAEVPDSFEYREDRYVLSNVEFADQDERLHPDELVQRQVMLPSTEVDAFVLQAPDLAEKITTYLKASLGDLFIEASVELRFYPFGILEQRTMVRA